MASVTAPKMFARRRACSLGDGMSSLSSVPPSTARAYSSGRSCWKRDSGMPPRNMTVSIGNASGRRCVWKKWKKKMKPVASSASSLWMT